MKRFFTILVATLAFTFSANAQVTLQECRDKARENYPLVQADESVYPFSGNSNHLF